MENVNCVIMNHTKEKGIEIKIIPDSEMPETANENDVELIPPSPLEVFANHCLHD